MTQLRSTHTSAPTRFLITALGIALFLSIGGLATPAQAQEMEDDGQDFFVLSENKVPFNQMGTINAIMDTTSSVILDQMVEEGLLKDWGVLRHAWGNEWNLNIYYVTESHEAFVTFWDEYVSRMQEQHPAALEKILSMTDAHRDNMYTRQPNP